MKLKLLLTFLGLFISLWSKADPDHSGAFITVWDTDKMDAGTSLIIPSSGSNYQYYWEKVGDEGNTNSGNYINSTTQDIMAGAFTLTAVKGKSGIYKVYIKGGYTRIQMERQPGSAKALTEVESWGNIAWTTMASAFYNCENLTKVPVAAPDLSKVSSLNYMFYKATAFNQDIGNWDVKNVTEMQYVFAYATIFNQDISGWNVSNVTSMYGMFANAKAFDQNIGNWDVSKVTNMTSMFYEADKFNKDISSWDVSKVTNMYQMFKDASAFNQNLGKWKLNASVNLGNIFSNSGLSSENYGLTLKGWAENTNTPTGKTLDATGLKYSSTYKQYHDLLTKAVAEGGKGWIINDAGEEAAAPDHTGAFVTVWNTNYMNSGIFTIPAKGTNYQYYWEKVGDEANTNSGTYQINSGELSLPALTNQKGTYRLYIKGDYTWESMVTLGSTLEIAAAAPALTAVESWGNIQWTSMQLAFGGCSNLLSLPNAAPDLSLVTSTMGMFFLAEKFNQDISNWDVSNITDMSTMFALASSFDQDISSWNVSNVTSMNNMFNAAKAFNQNIGGWEVSNVTDMSSMFSNTKLFNQDISKWKVDNVTNMSAMFDNALSFNQNLSAWNTENVTNMSRMFYYALKFDGDISSWNVSNVNNMGSMFYIATAFNQDISNWDISKVTDMSNMFYAASKFDQNLGKWLLNNNVNLSGLLDNSGLSAENYGLTLKGWAENPNTPSNVILGAAGLKYDPNSQQYRDMLTINKNWQITDDEVLPVTLISFTAKAQANAIQINWQTASESNNSHFLVEKSIDGINFNYLDKIGAKGAGAYEAYDKQPSYGNNYYRLTQFDKDGTATDHGIQVVNFQIKATEYVKVYPNPMVSNISTTVTFPAGIYNKAVLTDINGNTVNTTFIPTVQENIRIETDELPAGIYFIRLSGQENTVKKIIKQ